VNERTFVMIKPDAVAGGQVGRIVARFEEVGLVIERMEFGVLPRATAEANYAEHAGKPFYESLIGYVTSGPVVRMVLSGPGAVAIARKLIGATNPADAAPGTIRGDLGLTLDANVIHGSDSPASAEREIGIFFG
jgi:nucleoside-diphosphate kinase